jgi:uncharacterized protein (TIGR03437 family)
LLSRVALFVLAYAIGAAAQPFSYYRGVSNAASYAPAGLPNGPIARGSIFTVFGRNMGPTEGVQVSEFPLGNTLAGVSLDVCQNNACIAAIPVYVRQDQINAIMPSNAPLGPVSLRVTYNGQAGNFTSAAVVATSPGIFTINSGGYGPGVIQNFVAENDQPVNSAVAAARPGQTLILWGTGLGAGLNSDNVAPQPGDLPVNIDIWAGGKPVAVKRYAGRSQCCSGLDQIVFDLPPDTPTGCYVPIQLRANGAAVSNSATIAVSADGGPCADPFNPVAEQFRGGGRFGFIIASRTNTLHNFIKFEPEETTDSVVATFRQIPGGPHYFDPEISLPPLGSCTVNTARADLLAGDNLPGSISPTGELDAGAELRFGGIAVTRPNPGSPYSGLIASTIEDFGLQESLLSAPIGIQAPGGADVSAFQFQLQPPGPISFANRAGLDIVDRSQGLTVTWQGGDSERDVVLIAGVGVNLSENASAEFVCASDPAAGSFTAPPQILQAMPPAPDPSYPLNAFGYVYVGRQSVRAPANFEATGIAAGRALVSQRAGRAILFR